MKVLALSGGDVIDTHFITEVASSTHILQPRGSLRHAFYN